MTSSKMKTISVLWLLTSCINANTGDNLPDVRGKMIELLTSCFADRLKTVLTTSDLGERFLETSRDSIPIPIILIDKSSGFNDYQPIMLHMGTFVFAPESTGSFEMMLRTVKSSPWWHIKALFFIIGNSREGCEPAADILKKAWQMNLLSTLYLCYDRDNGAMLYTYNPYINWAPRPWKEIEMFERRDDRWTLYVRRYSEGRESCADLDFDKKKFMDGYTIKSVSQTKPGEKWVKNKNYNFDSLIRKYMFVNAITALKIVFSAMNITTIVNYDNPGCYYNGKAVGFLPALLNGSYDIALAVRSLVHNISGTYPFVNANPKILTQQRNFLLPEEKIWLFYSSEIKYLTGITLLIAFIFILVIYKKRVFALAAFDVLRLLLSASLFVPFNKTAIRIFFFCVFQLIIILHATFQGNLSAFLTKPKRFYIDNLEDLHNYQYTVYAPSVYQSYLEMSGKSQNIKFQPGEECTTNVINDPSAACIQNPQTLIKLAVKHHLHISRSDLAGTYLTYWCREDWPLKEKYELYESRVVEAGLYEYFASYNLNIPLEKLYSREEEETTAQYRPIKLADLKFAFQFLAFGLGISIFVFMIEMIMWRKCLRIVKKTKQNCSISSIITKLKRRK